MLKRLMALIAVVLLLGVLGAALGHLLHNLEHNVQTGTAFPIVGSVLGLAFTFIVLLMGDVSALQKDLREVQEDINSICNELGLERVVEPVEEPTPPPYRPDPAASRARWTRSTPPIAPRGH